MDFRQNMLVVSGTVAFYCGFFYLNQYLFHVLPSSTGASWISLHSAVQLFAVLLFAQWGALGVVLGGICVALSQTAMMSDPGTVMGTIFLSGLAPLLARQICIGFSQIEADLHRLSPGVLLRVAAMFAATSAGLHQLWFAWRGASDDILAGLLLMFTGDLLGTLIVLYIAKAVLSVGVRIRRG
ncbi:MAG: hypothetical protein QE279_03180 [Rhodoferax sp.]|nr:hypothetical protein [Rhodoferax sp.]